MNARTLREDPITQDFLNGYSNKLVGLYEVRELIAAELRRQANSSRDEILARADELDPQD